LKFERFNLLGAPQFVFRQSRDAVLSGTIEPRTSIKSRKLRTKEKERRVDVEATASNNLHTRPKLLNHSQIIPFGEITVDGQNARSDRSFRALILFSKEISRIIVTRLA